MFMSMYVVGQHGVLRAVSWLRSRYLNKNK